ncbi:MAG: DUF2207 domain-containing protein [Actinomycetota bacterium]
MPISRRRRLAVLGLVVMSIIIAGATALVAAAADTERIDGYWTSARLTDDGLVVTEVIDYDFGVNSRRGILRNVPDVVAGSVSVSSPTAPDQFTVLDGFVETTIRIGDPNTTITGRHRYRIDYTLERDSVVQADLLSWNAIGLDWTVPLSNIEAWLVVPGSITSPTCRQGTVWEPASCELREQADGTYRATIEDISPGEGATLSGSAPAPGAAAAGPTPPSGPATDPGSGVSRPALIALAATIIAGLIATVVTRRAGRERVWTGGAADAAFGEAIDGLDSRRLDEKQLAALATIEFEPPRDTSAVEGGLLLHERVQDEHLAAWLLESAIRGEITLDSETDDDPVLGWGSAPAHPSVHQILDSMFDGRREISLGEYDEDFAEGWGQLRAELKDWLHGSAHWDESGRKRQTRWRGLSVLGVLLGGLIGGIATAIAATQGGGALIGVAIGGVIVGIALGTLLSSYELLVRTEAGSAMWLRIESFRRFLENSEARHVDDAAERGVLRHYTAWAVALGESKAWASAVEADAAGNPELRSTMGRDLAFVYVGSSIASASNAAATAPSSSSSGGSFSGGVGGGGGGGGGGSW